MHQYAFVVDRGAELNGAEAAGVAAEDQAAQPLAPGTALAAALPAGALVNFTDVAPREAGDVTLAPRVETTHAARRATVVERPKTPPWTLKDSLFGARRSPNWGTAFDKDYARTHLPKLFGDDEAACVEILRQHYGLFACCFRHHAIASSEFFTRGAGAERRPSRRWRLRERSAEYPRRGRGVAAAPPSRNRSRATASPRPVPTKYPRRKAAASP